MEFVNPFELLELESLDNDEIRKARKRKLAEIELSDDGSISYGQLRITKSDLLKVVDQLEDSSKNRFFFNLLALPSLTKFLKHGDLSFFHEDKAYPIFEDSAFLAFVGPFFSRRFNEVFKSAFEARDIFTLRLLVQKPPLIQPDHQDQLYSGVYQPLRHKLEDLMKIRQQIENETGQYDENNTDQLIRHLKRSAESGLLNSLPPYFMKVRSDIAQQVRNISVAVFNTFNDSQAALDILSVALELKSNSLTKTNLQKDYDQIEEIHQEREEAAQYEAPLKRYSVILMFIKRTIDDIDNGNLTIEQVKSSLADYLKFNDLNALPPLFQGIKNQIAIGLKAISVVVWNNFSDLEYSLFLIQKAKTIDVDSETEEILDDALKQLTALRDQQTDPVIRVLKGINGAIRSVNQSHNQTVNIPKVQQALSDLFQPKLVRSLAVVGPNAKRAVITELRPILQILPSGFVNSFVDRLLPLAKSNDEIKNSILGLKKVTSTRSSSSSGSSDNSGCIWGIILLVGFLAFALAMAEKDRNDSYSYSPSYSTPSNPPGSSSSTYSQPTQEPSAANISPPVSKYEGNQLENGASPLDACFGKGKYRQTNSWILIKNGNASDAIVCLVDVRSGQTIRNEYIRAGQNFKMTKLPNGTFYLKAFYGKDWNPTKINACGTKGGFDTNVHFSASDGPGDYIRIEDDGYYYTTGEITLYTVLNGNMDQRGINESEFFR